MACSAVAKVISSPTGSTASAARTESEKGAGTTPGWSGADKEKEHKARRARVVAENLRRRIWSWPARRMLGGESGARQALARGSGWDLTRTWSRKKEHRPPRWLDGGVGKTAPEPVGPRPGRHSLTLWRTAPGAGVSP